jgi:hypothetical protein
VVRTRLERDVDGGATGLLAGRLESNDLGMWAAFALVPTLADHVLARNNDRPDDRVRVRRASPALCELDRSVQKLGVHAADPTAGRCES